MVAELLRGQNQPLTHTRLEVRITADVELTTGVIVDGIASGPRLAHPGAPTLPGVRVPARTGRTQRVALDLAAPATETARDSHRLTVLLALPDTGGAAPGFGAVSAPRVAVAEPDGAEFAAFTLHGLGRESAVAAVEFYRRAGAWRLRAVGQGYAAGLPRMLRDYGFPDAVDLAHRVHAAAPPPTPQSPATTVPAQRDGATAPGGGTGPARADEDRVGPGEPVAGDAVGWTMEERLYNQVTGMFEDLARRIAAYRGALEFADARLEREVDAVLADPARRTGAAAEVARERAQARRDALVDQARAQLDHDLRQLTAESEVVEAALPPAYAGWESPAWHGYRPPAQPPAAVRLGDVHLPEVPELRIPLLLPLPPHDGLWIDSGTEYGIEPGPASDEEAERARRRATEVGAALAVRLLAAHPIGGLAVHLVDPTGMAAGAFAPLARSGALRQWSGTGADGVSGALAAMTRRVDLATMALRAGAPDALPPDLGPAAHLLVVAGFPYDFDDGAVNRLRYLLDEGPAAGVHVMLIADRADARSFGPLLDPLWRSLVRLTPFPDDHLADPWVGHRWTYEPCLPPEGSDVLRLVLNHLAEAREAHGS
jgi:hypothetical protein